MTAPRLEACTFGPGPDGRWDRFVRVLRWTAARHCADWQINVASLDRHVVSGPSRSVAHNTSKLEYWADRIDQAADGDRVCLVDADTFVTRALDPVWDRDFDLAYTVRSEWLPFNGGVLFLRVSPRVKQFMRHWLKENMRLLADQPARDAARALYGGINQSALAIVLKGSHGLQLTELPCREWNCEDTSWPLFDPAITRIVHVKSALRMACIESQPIPMELKALAALWKSLEREALAAAGEVLPQPTRRVLMRVSP